MSPNRMEAQIIGDLADADGMSSAGAMKKYIAKIPKDSLKSNPFLDIYWEQGVYRHPQNSFGISFYVWLRQRAASIVKKIDNQYNKR